MKLKRLTYPTAAPATLAQAKTQLIIEHSLDDALINAMLLSATQTVENYISAYLMQSTFAAYYDNAQSFIELPAYNISAVTAVKYLDANDAEQTLAATAYEVDLNAFKPIVKINQVPTVSSKSFNVFWVEFTAGYTGATAADQQANIALKAGPLVSAILLQTASLYENREDVNFKKNVLIKASEYLAHPFKNFN